MTYEQQQKYKQITTRLHRIGVVGPTEQILALDNEVEFYRDKVQKLEDALRAERGGVVDREARWKGLGMGDYYCSLCQHTMSGRTKFCPVCGAKMDEWEEGVNDAN